MHSRAHACTHAALWLLLLNSSLARFAPAAYFYVMDLFLGFHTGARVQLCQVQAATLSATFGHSLRNTLCAALSLTLVIGSRL